MKTSLASLTAAALFGLGLAASPAAALPVGPVLADGPSALVEVQSRKKAQRGKSMRRSAMRGRRVSRGGDPNSRDPSRAPSQQSRGDTSGGPRN